MILPWRLRLALPVHAACEDFGEVLNSVEQAGPATTVAKLRALFAIKAADKA